MQRGDLPPILDFEHAASITNNLTSPQFYDWVDTWVSVVESATRRKPMIYAGGFWKQMLDDYTDVWGGCPLWLAQYASQPQLPRSWKSWTLWQFTSKAQLEGIARPVDLSYFHGSATSPSPEPVRPGPGGLPAPSRDVEVPRSPRVLRCGARKYGSAAGTNRWPWYLLGARSNLLQIRTNRSIAGTSCEG